MSYCLTIASTPPTSQRARRGSRWDPVLEEFRANPEEWRRVAKPMAQSTARQLASDFRCSSHREPETLRVRAIRPNDRWEAVTAFDPDGPEGPGHYLWLCWSAGVEYAW